MQRKPALSSALALARHLTQWQYLDTKVPLAQPATFNIRVAVLNEPEEPIVWSFLLEMNTVSR
jgi:hypothetical protein